MKFYLVLDPNGYRHLETAQAAARGHGGTFQEIDIPTDKEGLKAAVQELLTEADNLRLALPPAPAAPAESQQEPGPAHDDADQGVEVSAPVQQLITQSKVIDFVLEDASTAQVEDIFTALGTRFAEANRLAQRAETQVDEAPTAG